MPNVTSPFTGIKTYDTETDKNTTDLKNKAGDVIMGAPSGLNKNNRWYGLYLYLLKKFTYKSIADDPKNNNKKSVTFTVEFIKNKDLPADQSLVLRIFHEGSINTTSCVFLNTAGTIPPNQKITTETHASAVALATGPTDIVFNNLQLKADRDQPYTIELRTLHNTTGNFNGTLPFKILNFNWES